MHAYDTFGCCKAKHHLKKGYFAEKQNTTSNKQTSKHVQRETTKHSYKQQCFAESKTPFEGKNMHAHDAFAVKQSTI